jgi:hypothetical protein
VPRRPKLTKESQNPNDTKPKTDDGCHIVNRGHAAKERYDQADNHEHAA